MEKIELRCKLMEQKEEKLKIYKKVIKRCGELICVNCKKTFSFISFVQHLKSDCFTSKNYSIFILNKVLTIN